MLFRALLCVTALLSSQSYAQEALIAPRAKDGLITGFTQLNGKLLVVGERGHLFELGEGIEQQPFPSQHNLNAISAAGPSVCIVGYGDSIFLRENPAAEWTQVNPEPRADGVLFDVCLNSAESGLAVGSFGGAYGTRDGRNWEVLSYGDYEAHLYQVKSDGSDGWYVAGELGNLFRVGANLELTRRYGAEGFDQPTFFGLEVLGEDEFIAYGLVGRFVHVKGELRTNLENPRPYSTFASLRVGTDLLFFGADGTILLYRDGKLHDRSTSDKRVIVSAALKGDTLLLGTVAGIREIPLKEVLR